MYLFDASAIVNLVKRGSLKPLGGGASLDLAVCETLNAVWKGHRLRGRLDSDTARALAGILKGVFGVIPLGSIRGFEVEVYELESGEGLTVYDAAYLCLALKERLTLVSDDG